MDYRSLAKGVSDLMDTMVQIRETNLNPGQYPHPADPGYEYWLSRFIALYDADAMTASFGAGSVQMVSQPDLLRFEQDGASLNQLGDAIANYWMNQLTPGRGGISLTNDASKLSSMIAGYLDTYSDTATVIDLPAYEHLFKFIEGAVKTVNWYASDDTVDNVVS